jgi:hypothetical protein
VVKPASEFYPNSKARDGLGYQCRECAKAAAKAWREANPERAKAKDKARYAANPHREKARGKAYRDANRERVNAVARAYRDANRECVNAKQRAKYAADSERVKAYRKAYRDANRERLATARKARRAANPERVKAIGRAHSKARRANSQHALNHSVSEAVRRSLRGNKAGRRWEILVGYALDELRAHIESKWMPGMTWDNFGDERRVGCRTWHLDHIVASSKWKFKSAEDLQFSWHGHSTICNRCGGRITSPRARNCHATHIRNTSSSVN